jgi:hypothetical protein
VSSVVAASDPKLTLVDAWPVLTRIVSVAAINRQSLGSVLRKASIHPDRGYRIFRGERPPSRGELARLTAAVGLGDGATS